jgi:YhcH/YjgK/YiaL family protein
MEDSAMILDRLSSLAAYAPLHPGIAAAVEWLEGRDLAALPPGRQSIDGERLFANVDPGQGKGRQGARLEAHRKYIDIQIAVVGTDVIGWKSLDECRFRFIGYDAEIDAELPDDAPEAWFELVPGAFAIFFPRDAHAPLAGHGALRKVIVKLRADW